MRVRLAWGGAIGVFVFLLYVSFFQRDETDVVSRKTLTVYTWLDFIPEALQQKFEEETGVKLHIDYINSDEALEAKLLTGKSEYDLVYPSTPYVFRHINLGLFQPLDRTKLPNLKYLDKGLVVSFEVEKQLFAIPYLWGSSGFAYDKDVFDKIFFGEKINSWGYLFDPQKLTFIRSFGLAMTSSANEMFVALGFWKDVNLACLTSNNLHLLAQFGKEARPYWTAFLSSDSAVQALASGEVISSFIWNGDAAKARDLAKLQGRNIRYVVPREGALKWVDSLAIPHNAPNANGAHKLINFLLKPENMALVTNVVRFANTSQASKAYISRGITSDEVLYPTQETQERLVLDRRSNSKIERTINRYFFRILVGY